MLDGAVSTITEGRRFEVVEEELLSVRLLLTGYNLSGVGSVFSTSISPGEVHHQRLGSVSELW